MNHPQHRHVRDRPPIDQGHKVPGLIALSVGSGLVGFILGQVIG